MDLVGKTLGQFEIVDRLGKGGMATVYKAYQPRLQRYVAIKVLSPTLAEDADLVRRFLREAQAAAALHHPHVIVIHDVGSQGDIHYIVAEYLEGMTLAQLLEQDGAQSLDRVLHILRQVADALDYAHARGYIHRDVKPSNIMVDPERNDHVTLMDFGLVQVTGGSRITRTGFIMGTPDYMSPEQAKGDAIDRRTDVYSLGVTAYHMLTGDVPFSKPTPHAILMAHIMEEPPSMSTPGREIPPEVEAVVCKSLAKRVDDRYDWAGDMVSDLETAITLPAALPPFAVVEPARGRSTTTESAIPKTPPLGTVPSRTPPPGAPAYPAPYPQAPPPGVLAREARPRWVWPVVGAAGVGLLAVLVVVGVLIAPSILSRLPSAARLTEAARLTQTASFTEVAQLPGATQLAEAVELTATAQAASAVTQAPTIQKETRASPPSRAPVIEHFEVVPQEQVQGAEVELSWRVTGETTGIEISANSQTIPALPAEGTLSVVAEQTTLFVLTAYNGDLRSDKSIRLAVVQATPNPTPTPAVPLAETPTATHTLAPTPVPPTATSAPTRPAAPTPTLAPSSGVPISFEQWGTWVRGEQPYGELDQTQEQVKSGDYAAKLSYDFPESDQDFVVFRNLTAVGGSPNTVSAWVYGDGSSHFLNVWIEDAQDQVWSVHLGRVGAAGWQQMVGAIDANRSWPSGHVFGPDNGIIDYPIHFYGLVLDRPAAGPYSGQIYVDDISFAQAEVSAPEPGATATPEVDGPSPGQIGRIVFTVQVGELYALYSTDPSWDTMVKIGDTDWEHSTCAEGNVATTLEGIAVNLGELDRCPIAGTVDSCTSPDGQYKVNTNRKGNDYQITLWRTSDDKMLEAYYTGKLNIHPGLNWAPDSSHFLFTVDQSVYRANVGEAGYRLIIPFKHSTWPLQYTADGAYVYYLKPVSGEIADIYLANPDGSNERNLTHSSIAVKLCPRWRQ